MASETSDDAQAELSEARIDSVLHHIKATQPTLPITRAEVVQLYEAFGQFDKGTHMFAWHC